MSVLVTILLTTIILLGFARGRAQRQKVPAEARRIRRESANRHRPN